MTSTSPVYNDKRILKVEYTAMQTLKTAFITLLFGFIAPISIASALTLDGNVTSTQDNAAIADIEVSVYQENPGGTWQFVAYTNTNSTGDYSLTDIPPGPVKVLFRDWGQTYAYQYHDGAIRLEDAQPLPFTASTTLNQSLSVGGSIAGTLTDTNNNSVDQGFIALFDAQNPQGNVIFIQQLQSGQDSYEIGGLPSGDFIARYSGTINGTGHLEYYENVPDVGFATPIDVTLGQTTTVDVILGEQSGLDITGSVTNSSNMPLGNIETSLYRWTGSAWTMLEYTETDGSGQYAFEDLNPGDYKLQFRDWSQDYAFQFWPASNNLQDAQIIAVTDASQQIDITLPQAGRITGSITDPAGRPLQYPSAAVFPANGDTSSVLFITQPAGSDYDIGGLPTGDYVVRFDGRQSGNRSFQEYYENADSFEGATPVSVTAGQTESDINAVMGIGPGGIVEGSVRDRYGRKWDYAHVTAYMENNGIWEAISDTQVTYQDDDYDYRLYVPQGSFRLRFEAGSYLAPEAASVQEYYIDAPTPEQAQTLSISLDERLEDIDAELGEFANASISGQVRDISDTGVSGIEVIPLDRRLRPLVDQISVTDASGVYQIPALWPETYYLRFYDPLGRYENTYLGNTASPADAATVAVKFADVTGVDITLDSAPANAPGSITGNLSTTEGQPVPRARVAAYEYPCEDDYGYLDCQFASSTITDVNGNYRVRDLPSGQYILHFGRGGNDFLQAEYYNDRQSAETADPVTVSAPQATTAIDGQLAGAGVIEGTVTNPFGQSFAILSVNAYQWIDDEWQTVAYTFEQRDSEYRLASLPAGNYRVGFQGGSFGGANPGGTDYFEFYDDADVIENGLDINVSVDTVTSGIDAVLGVTPPGAISGTVTDAGDTAQAGITVTLYDDLLTQQDQTLTDANGQYAFTPLYDGIYFVGFSDTGGTLDGEFYPDVATLDLAAPIFVNGAAITDIDAILDGANSAIGGGQIRGQVTAQGSGAGIAGIRVRCDLRSDYLPTLPCFGLTDSNGVFSIGGNLLSGDYTVSVSDTEGVYSLQYYDDVIVRSEATPVSVTVGAQTSNIDFALQPGASISGTITRNAGGTYEIIVANLYQYNANQMTWEYVTGDVELNNSSYRIDGIPPGSYRLYFRGNGVASFTDPDFEFWENQETIESADVITLVSGDELTGYDAALGDVPEPPVTNAQFHAGIEGWLLTGAAQQAWHSTTDVFADPQSGSIQWNSSDAASIQQCIAIDAHSGDIVQFGATVQATGSGAAASTVTLEIQGYSDNDCSSSALIADDTSSMVAPDSQGWKTLQNTVTATATLKSVKLTLRSTAASEDLSIAADNLVVRALTDALFVSGFE